jgi:hypothetical protein
MNKIMKKVATALIWICSHLILTVLSEESIHPLVTRREISSKWVGPTPGPAEYHSSLPHGMLPLCHVDDMDR